MEHRRAPRKPLERPGLVIADDGETYPCIASDISPRGARITLLGRHQLPGEFSLSLFGERYRCRLVWRTCFHVGIEFLAPLEVAKAEELATAE